MALHLYQEPVFAVAELRPVRVLGAQHQLDMRRLAGRDCTQQEYLLGRTCHKEAQDARATALELRCHGPLT